MNVESVLTALLAAAILSSVPVMLAGVGEAVSERSGLLNLGVEGVMLTGAFVAFVVALGSESAGLGLLVSFLVGGLVGVGFGFLTTVLAADQVVLGLGVTLAGSGGTAYLFRERYGSDQPLLAHGLGRPFDGLLDWLPVIGPAVGNQRWFVYVAWLIVLAVHLMLYRTRIGLQIRAAGESPLGLEAVGGNVTAVRIIAATIGGSLAGLGGGSLAVVELGFFSPGVTAGVGFLAIALAMLGRLSPVRVGVASLGFGVLTGLDTGLQIAGVDARPEFLQMIPYLGVVIALVIVGRRIALPAHLGQSWRGVEHRT
jgi:simple sugar transport system permease protein